MASDKPGIRLKLWRVGGEVRQNALAQQLGISQTHLSQIEAGNGLPGRDLAIRIEDLTGISAREWSSPASECETQTAVIR